ncbi:GNAT family N-acetyltransferase [Pseudoneobacillus sp. C159]
MENCDNIECMTLQLADIHANLLKSFNRYQETKVVWYKDGHQFRLKNDYFIDNWTDEKKAQVIAELEKCLQTDGIVVGTFRNDGLVGFANIEGEQFGSENQYRELPYIHVSNEYRGQGVGKKLFQLICEKAKGIGTKKLYIAAHPSIETQHFYRSLGCTYATEINQQILKREPLDIQMEYIL